MIKIERIINMSSKDNSLIEIAIELLYKKNDVFAVLKYAPEYNNSSAVINPILSVTTVSSVYENVGANKLPSEPTLKYGPK